MGCEAIKLDKRQDLTHIKINNYPDYPTPDPITPNNDKIKEQANFTFGNCFQINNSNPPKIKTFRCHLVPKQQTQELKQQSYDYSNDGISDQK